MMDSSKADELRLVVPAPDDVNPSLDIVLIPGIGTPAVDGWPFSSKEWLEQWLPAQAKRSRVFAYDFHGLIDGLFSWESLILQGYSLLRAMATVRSNQDDHRPLLCVCHSLGGVILKQALCIANEQLHRYECLVSAITGIVFISTPHSAPTEEDTYALFANVLKAIPRKNIRVFAELEHRESALLWDLAHRFEAIHFRTPVLSLYETKASNIAENRFRSRLQTLVDQSSCTTTAPLERTVGLDLDHISSCHFHLASTKIAVSFSEFLTEILQNAEELISTRLRALKCTYATAGSYSLTNREVAFPDFGQTHPLKETDDATNGSTHFDLEHVPGAVSIDSSRPNPRLPCAMLENLVPNTSYSGREDIMLVLEKELVPPKDKVICSQNNGLRQYALCGFGGIGKTEIAREFALAHQNDFDAIFWIPAEETTKLDRRYQQICVQLGLEDATECKSYVVSRELVKGWLSKPWQAVPKDNESLGTLSTHEPSWLIIFDNADDPMLLTDYWPQGNGSVLITSRDPSAKSIGTTRSSGIDLQPLNKSDSAKLLLKLTNNDPSNEYAEEEVVSLAENISVLLGGVPLAISQMSSIIQREDLTLREFLDLYSDLGEHPGLHEMRFDATFTPYPHSIATVWAIEKLRPGSRRFIESVSFFDPDSIEEGLLFELMAEMFSCCKDEYRKARTELLQASLIQRSKQNHELYVHRLVQDAVRAKLDEREAREIFETMILVLWANWPSAMPKPSKGLAFPRPKASNTRLEISRWPVCAALYPHVLKIHQIWPSVKGLSDRSKLQFAALLNDAAWYQSERGRTYGFDGFFQSAEALCQDVDHPDKDSILSDIYFALGAIAADTNDHEASRRYKDMSFDLQYAISQKMGIEDERLALAYSERSISRIQDGRLEEGISDLKREREIRTKLGTYIPLSREANLGLAYLMQGSLEECESLLLESLDIRERELGKNDKESFRTGRILYALGNLRSCQGRLEESYTCHLKAYEQFRSTIGNHHHRTADIEHKISEHLARMGKNEEAINMINNALKTWSFDTVAYKPELARMTFLKAKLLQAMGREQKGGAALKVAARLRREIVGDKKKPDDLKMEDFDTLVAFWSR